MLQPLSLALLKKALQIVLIFCRILASLILNIKPYSSPVPVLQLSLLPVLSSNYFSVMFIKFAMFTYMCSQQKKFFLDQSACSYKTISDRFSSTEDRIKVL